MKKTQGRKSRDTLPLTQLRSQCNLKAGAERQSKRDFNSPEPKKAWFRSRGMHKFHDLHPFFKSYEHDGGILYILCENLQRNNCKPPH